MRITHATCRAGPSTTTCRAPWSYGLCLEVWKPQWIGRTPTDGKMACASAATVARSLTEKLRCKSCAATHLSNCVCKHRRHWRASCKRPSQALRTQSSAFGRGCRSCSSSSSNRRLGHLGHLQQQLQQQPHSNRRLGHLQHPQQPHCLGHHHPGHRPMLHRSRSSNQQQPTEATAGY